MTLDAALEGFRQINSADEIARSALCAMQEANIERYLSILAFFEVGVIKESIRLSEDEEIRFLAFMETYLEDVREQRGMFPGQSFNLTD